MKENTIITINRQCASCGDEVALALSKALSIPFYDKEIIKEAAKKSGLNENLFEHAEERPASLLYSFAMGTSNLAMVNMNEEVFKIQSNAIAELAASKSCLFVGRCADYVLRQHENRYHFFIYAHDEDRIKRLAHEQNITEKAAEDLMHKTDKKRASYYHYYTGRKWQNPSLYDLCINTSKIGIDGAAQMILSYIESSKN